MIFQTRVRLDFCTYIHGHDLSRLSAPAQGFFMAFQHRKIKFRKETFYLLRRLWKDEPVITTWLYLQFNERIPAQLLSQLSQKREFFRSTKDLKSGFFRDQVLK